ncbi:MAG: hypothetical protein R3253_15990, partial [Longimicrobiales bacterium]|nr:hypothetical protein [Longimicrobiales bacterium]
MQPNTVRALVVLALLVAAVAAAFVEATWLRALLVIGPILFIGQRALLSAVPRPAAAPSPPVDEDRRSDMTVRRHIKQLLELIRDFYSTCHMVAVGQLSPAKAKSRARDVEEKLNE